MIDDIVTRLREAHQKVLPDFYCNNLRFDACYEIERLRKEVSNLRLLANLWASEFNSVYKDLKAVRGE